MGRLDGKVAIVTGGARGIGAAVATLLAHEGAWVCVADVLREEGEAVASSLPGQAAYHHLDVTSEEDWSAAVSAVEQAHGPVSVLVNSAGILHVGTIEETSPEAFRHVLDVNLYGTWLGLHATIPSLRRSGGGAVVNISSTAGLMGYANLGAYVSSKWALRGLSKTAALELAADGIRVCSVHPSIIRTPMAAGMDSSMAAAQPLPRFGTPEEVARMVLFIIADATYSTGTEFIIDGGATVGGVIASDLAQPS
ncbi:MAG: SDR family oxidoreductase [Streptomyces sp.]|nr:SDR family oxidoreductase [Streptomyces sp.]